MGEGMRPFREITVPQQIAAPQLRKAKVLGNFWISPFPPIPISDQLANPVLPKSPTIVIFTVISDIYLSIIVIVADTIVC